jgi:hypothetical protein
MENEELQEQADRLRSEMKRIKIEQEHKVKEVERLRTQL